MRSALGSLLVVLGLTLGVAHAQTVQSDGPYEVAQADTATLGLRVDRLENQVRALTGQNEQLQFQLKRLEDSLRKFQEDVEFRFQDGAKSPSARPSSGRRGDLGDAAAPVVAEAPPAEAAAPPATRARRGAAFDPASEPNAPGAPKPLGSTAPSSPLTRRDLAAPARNDQPGAPMDLGPRGAAVGPALSEPVVAAIPQPSTPAPVDPAREAFNAATTAFRGGQYAVAETGFSDFLLKYPKDRLTADAMLSLGDTYSRRARTREAAEQYLKVSTDFAKSPRAPEALVRLGQSLEKLGAKEQACAAYAEVGRKYPAAPGVVRASADRESARAQC